MGTDRRRRPDHFAGTGVYLLNDRGILQSVFLYHRALLFLFGRVSTIDGPSPLPIDLYFFDRIVSPFHAFPRIYHLSFPPTDPSALDCIPLVLRISLGFHDLIRSSFLGQISIFQTVLGFLFIFIGPF